MFAIDTIFENARFQTMNPAHPWASRIGVYDGKIVGLDGDLDGVDAREHVDLVGRYACPGFHDAHLHFTGLGANLNQVDLRPVSAPTMDELYARIREAARTTPAGKWILGWGFNQFSLGGFPQRSVLDSIAGDHPVFILHISNHAAVINTQAFCLAGFDDPDTQGDPSLVIRENGSATGLVKDTVCFRIMAMANRVDEATLLHQLALAADYTLAKGITTYEDAGTGTDSDGNGIGQTPGDIGLFQTAYEQGLIHQRGILMPYFAAMHDLGELSTDIPHGFGIDLGLRTGFGGDMLSIGPFKIILDGAFNSLSAYLKEPYASDAGNTGVFSWDPDEFTRDVAILHREGWRMAVHAIGDRSVDIALDAIENAQRLYPRHDMRHRLEHVGLADDATVERIIADGIVPNPQGSFMHDNGDSYLRLLGDGRGRRAYRMGAFVHRGAVIPGSTDAPCAPVDPLISLEGMVTRRTAGGEVLGEDERLTVDEALRAYTYGSAYAAKKEDVLGTLARSKYADIVVLSDDPHDVEPDSIHELSVEQTIVGGIVRYDAGR